MTSSIFITLRRARQTEGNKVKVNRLLGGIINRKDQIGGRR